MKPLFFFLFVFLSFAATAQFPKPGHDGYVEGFVGNDTDNPPLAFTNGRNKFLAYPVNVIFHNATTNTPAIRDSIFQGRKYAFNQRYYYANFEEGNYYNHLIFLPSRMLILSVSSMFNDAEFEK